MYCCTKSHLNNSHLLIALDVNVSHNQIKSKCLSDLLLTVIFAIQLHLIAAKF